MAMSAIQNDKLDDSGYSIPVNPPQARDIGMGERITRLETNQEHILKEQKRLSERMENGFQELGRQIQESEARTESHIRESEARLENHIRESETRSEKRIMELEARTEKRDIESETRLEKLIRDLADHTDRRFFRLENKISKHFSWLLGFCTLGFMILGFLIAYFK